MAEIIGQHERGTLFENGQMDPFEVLKMLEDAGAFSYHFSLSSEFFIEGIHATPVIDLGLSKSSSRNLIDKVDSLNIKIVFDKESKFSCLPPAIVIKVSSSQRMSGSTVDFPASSVFDIGHLTFQVTSIMLMINGHYLTVFNRLRYDPQTDTLSATYWLSDSKSDVQDCGHHVPSIVEIDEEHFERLWKNHAISITCVRIQKIVQIDGIPHEWNGAYFKPLKPAWESLPECDKRQYAILGPNGEILIKNCMSPFEFQPTFSPPPPAPFEKVSQALPTPPEPKALTVRFDDGIFRNIPGYPNTWTYTYLHGKVCFKAEGTFQNEQYSNRKYFYKGEEYCGSLLQTILRDACVEFLKENLPK